MCGHWLDLRSRRRRLLYGLIVAGGFLLGVFLWDGRVSARHAAGDDVAAVIESPETVSQYFTLAGDLLSKVGIELPRPRPSQVNRIRLKYEPPTARMAAEVSLFCKEWSLDVNPSTRHLVYYYNAALTEHEYLIERQAKESGDDYVVPRMTKEEALAIAGAADQYRVFGRVPGLEFEEPEIVFKSGTSCRGWKFTMRRKHDGVPFHNEYLSFEINDHSRSLVRYSLYTSNVVPTSGRVLVKESQLKGLVASFFADRLPKLDLIGSRDLVWNESTFTCKGLEWVNANGFFDPGGTSVYYSLDLPLCLAYVCKADASTKNLHVGFEFWISAADGSIVGGDHTVRITVVEPER